MTDIWFDHERNGGYGVIIAYDDDQDVDNSIEVARILPYLSNEGHMRYRVMVPGYESIIEYFEDDAKAKVLDLIDGTPSLRDAASILASKGELFDDDREKAEFLRHSNVVSDAIEKVKVAAEFYERVFRYSNAIFHGGDRERFQQHVNALKELAK